MGSAIPHSNDGGQVYITQRSASSNYAGATRDLCQLLLFLCTWKGTKLWLIFVNLKRTFLVKYSVFVPVEPDHFRISPKIPENVPMNSELQIGAQSVELTLILDSNKIPGAVHSSIFECKSNSICHASVSSILNSGWEIILRACDHVFHPQACEISVNACTWQLISGNRTDWFQWKFPGKEKKKPHSHIEDTHLVKRP